MIYKKRPSDAKYEEGKNPPFVSHNIEPMSDWTDLNKTMTCPCCHTQYDAKEFPLVPDATWGWRDTSGNARALFCNDCLERIFEHFIEVDPDKSKFKALFRICMMTNVYYSDKIAHQVFEEDRVYDTGEPVSEHIGYTDLYIRTIANTPSLFDKPFWASDNFVFDDVLKWQTEIGSLSEEQKKERAAVVVGLHRDPYEDEKIEDRPQMYKDTLTMMTADVAENLPKARAIVEIIKAYSRVDRINKTLNELQATGQSMVDNEKSIKMLVEQKSKEMATISSLCKEYNLSDASSGGKGFGSISSIVRDMDDKSYDIGFVNRFDIETTQAMQQVADISMNAIFKQLKFSTADFAQIVQEQAQMIKTMQNTLAAQAEELRLLKAEHIKQELLEEYKLILQERKIDPKEIERVVAEQINWGVYGDKRIYDDITEGYQ